MYLKFSCFLLLAFLGLSCNSIDCVKASNSCVQGPCGEPEAGKVDFAVLNQTSIVLEKVVVGFSGGTEVFTGFDGDSFEHFSCWLTIGDSFEVQSISFSNIVIPASEITVQLEILSEGDFIITINEELAGDSMKYSAHIEGYTPCNDTPCL